MTYTYECEKCDIQEIVEHGMNESPEVKCKKCGDAMYKMISSNVRVLLKGDTTVPLDRGPAHISRKEIIDDARRRT